MIIWDARKCAEVAKELQFAAQMLRSIARSRLPEDPLHGNCVWMAERLEKLITENAAKAVAERKACA